VAADADAGTAAAPYPESSRVIAFFSFYESEIPARVWRRSGATQSREPP
jgi:hypothetical protein